MNILSYVKSLLPLFKRSTIETDAKQLLANVKKIAIPSFKRLAAVMAGKPFTTPLGKKVEADIRRHTGGNGTAAAMLYQMFNNLPAKLEYIIGIIDEEFGPDVSRDNMTYKQSLIVRFLELTHFGMQYSMRMGGRLVVAESRQQQKRADEIDAQLTPAELKWFDENYRSWLQVVGLMSTPTLKLRQVIEKMPDVVIAEATAAADIQSIGARKLDPLEMGLINVNAMNWNIIYHARVMISEIQVEMLRADEKEAIVLELQILELTLANQEKQDPKLEDQINYHLGRLQSLRQSIAEKRERYGVA